MEVSLKGIPIQGFLSFVFLIRTTTALEVEEGTKLTIKKCCPKGQELNSALICVNVTRDSKNNKVNGMDAGMEPSNFSNNPTKIFFPDFNDTSAENDSTAQERFPWFPYASLISSVTLEKIVDFETIKDLLEETNFEYGSRPECGSAEKEFGCFRLKYSEQFYLVLYPGRDIKLYISKKSSYHEEGHFKVENRDCGFSKIDPGENNTRGRENGDLLGNPLFNLQQLRTFPGEDFCLDKGPDESFLVEYCPCKTVPCIRKCCGDSELYDKANDRCVWNSTFGYWRPPLENSRLTKNYYLLPNRHPSTCKKPALLKEPQRGKANSGEKCGSQQEERNKFHFLSDGSLQIKNYDVPAGSYCGDHVIYDTEVFLENNFLICQPDDDSPAKFRAYGILFLFGGIILLVTVAFSFYLPQLRCLLFNKIIIAHNLSLMLADFFGGSAALLPHGTHEVCAFLSLARQSTLLGSFFWMNVLCWDEYLQSDRCVKSSRKAVGGNHKLLGYVIYACASPAVITCITAAMEFTPPLPPHYIRPGFDCYCGFNPDFVSILIYMYGPMTVIILVNLAFYFWTFMLILKIQKGATNKAKEKGDRKKRFLMFSKFFLSVNLSWLLEVFGWLLRGKDNFWYFPDFLSILRAAFIFVILIWEKNVLKGLMMKLKGCSDGAGRSRRDSGTDSDLAEVRRREKILRKQITQTFRTSGEFDC